MPKLRIYHPPVACAHCDPGADRKPSSAYSFGDRLPKAPLQPSIGVSRHSPDSSGLPTRIAPLIALSNRVRAGREQGVLESPDRGYQSAAGLSAHADSRAATAIGGAL